MDPPADLQFRDRALLVEDTLVLADLHVGRGVSSDLELPVGDGQDMVERVEALLARFDPEAVVVAGDLLHSFETVPRLVEETLDGIQQAIDDAGATLVVTPGNHDAMLDVVWDGETTPEYRVGDTVVCHGHVEPRGDATRYVVGHDHPTITIEGKRRTCYLLGEGQYRGADVLMLPSFNRLVPGVEINDMTGGEFMSPLVSRLGAFRPVVRDEAADETLVFPPLAEFRHRL